MTFRAVAVELGLSARELYDLFEQTGLPTELTKMARLTWPAYKRDVGKLTKRNRQLLTLVRLWIVIRILNDEPLSFGGVIEVAIG